MQTDRNRPAEKPALSAPMPPAAKTIPPKERKKRKRDPGADEIDELFSAAMGKKVKKAALAETAKQDSKPSTRDTDLSDVMGAIRAAPAEGKGHSKRKGR